MPFARVNGIRLHYEVETPPGPLRLEGPRRDVEAARRGDGAGGAKQAAVLFLHGLGSSCVDWALQVSAFAGRYRVLRLDLRAHGQSSGHGGGFTIETMADDVGALLAHLDEPPAHVVALSLGGCVALALALRQATRVRSLVLVNTFARFRSNGWQGLKRGLVRVWLLWFRPMPVMAAYVARGLFPKPEQRPLFEAAVASLSKNSRRTYFDSIRAIRRFDVAPQLGIIRCPTLIVAGDRDATVPLSAKALLHRSIPGAQMLVIPDSGHATPYDQAEAFNRAALEFIAAH